MERSKVQQLYDECKEVFSWKEGHPTLKQIKQLQDILDTMEPKDVGIDGSDDGRTWDDASNDPNLKSRDGLVLGQQVTEITYIHIHECERFSMGVFCFPAGAKFPLHDHPGMVVLSKVLYGSVSVKACDWINTVTVKQKKCGLARVVVDDRILQVSSKASVLFPRIRNIHSFTALTSCAILDVLSPPYSEELGRPSTYFSEIPIPSLSGFSLLEEEEEDVPNDLIVMGAPYVGPELIINVDLND